jgi:hypothetical protein
MIQVCLQVEPLDRASLPRREMATVLRGQLTLLRTRAERGIPVSVESISRAENVARKLEAWELAL